MAVLFQVDWDSGTLVSTTYTLATPEIPNAHTITVPASSVASEAASPWSGQWLLDLTASSTSGTSTLSASTAHATSGRLLLQFVPIDIFGSGNILIIAATNTTNGSVRVKETSGSMLAMELEFNASNTFLSYEWTMPANPTNIEVIYNSNGSGAARLQGRIWDVGGSPGSFVNASYSSGANAATDQFTTLTLGGLGDVSTLKIGKLFISDDVAEDLSALLGGASKMPLFRYQYAQRRN